MNILGIIVSNIASLRPKQSSLAAPALVFLLQGKGNLCQQMTGFKRDQLARSIQKLLKAVYALSDPDNVMGKLRTVMDALVAIGIGPAADGTQQHEFVSEASWQCSCR